MSRLRRTCCNAMQMCPLYLTEEDVAGLLTPAEAIDAVEGSFRRLAARSVANPARVRVAIDGGEFAVMPTVDFDLGFAAVKSYVWGASATSFAVLLFSLDARLEAVVEADKLGQL